MVEKNSSVNKNTSLIITNNKGTSGKLKKGKGIEIMDVNDFTFKYNL